jgi:hypothetical protein
MTFLHKFLKFEFLIVLLLFTVLYSSGLNAEVDLFDMNQRE